MNIGKQIKERREALGMTQMALAKMLGVYNTTVSQWERGNKIPDIKCWPALCKALECTESDLVAR